MSKGRESPGDMNGNNGTGRTRWNGGWEGKVKDRVWREITNTEDL